MPLAILFKPEPISLYEWSVNTARVKAVYIPYLCSVQCLNDLFEVKFAMRKPLMPFQLWRISGRLAILLSCLQLLWIFEYSGGGVSGLSYENCATINGNHWYIYGNLS